MPPSRKTRKNLFFFVKRKRHDRPFRYVVFPVVGLVIVAFVWSGFDRYTFLFGGLWLVAGLVLGAFKFRAGTPFEVPL